MQAGDEASGVEQAAVREPALKAFLQSFASRLRRWRKHVDRHVTAALLMVGISILGAIAAFEVALAEQTSVGLERRLSMGQLEDAGIRQGIYAELTYRVGLEGQARSLDKEAAELRLAKTGFFAGDRVASNWLDWRMAELRSQRSALERFKTNLANVLGDKPATVQIAERSAEELRRRGVAATAEEGDVRFPILEASIERAHKAAPALAFCVLLFVAALVCLTIAELDFGSRTLWWSLATAAVVLSIAGTIKMALVDPALWVIVPIAVALCAAAPFAIRWGVFSRRGGPKPSAHPENPEPARPALGYLAGHSGPHHDSWSRGIVALIAVSVLFSAVFAWAYSVAVKEEGMAALSAHETRTQFVTRQGTSVTLVAGGIFDSVIQAQAVRTRCAAATQFAALVRDRIVSGNLESAEQDRADACGKVQTIFRDDSRENVFSSMDDNDLIDSSPRPAFTLRQNFMNRPGGPNSLFALSDAKTAMSVRWSERAARYLAVLTVLAIVLFLFAQAHSMGHTTAGRLLRGAGIGLLVVSLAMGAFANVGDGTVAKARKATSCVGDQKLASAADVAELAAEKYALGVAAFGRGMTSAPGSPERKEADDEALSNLKCAILLLPDFIPAYRRYYEALGRIGSPERDESWMSLSNRTAVKELHENALAELRAATRAGLLRSSTRLADFAFSATRYALVEGDRQAIRDARIAVDSLVGRTKGWGVLLQRWQRPELFTDEDEPPSSSGWFNLGLLELASGEKDLIRDAPRLYNLALASEQGVSEPLAASALVDLEMLRSYCGNLHKTLSTCSQIWAAIDAIRGRIANLASSDQLPTDSPAAADGFAIDVTPYSVEWRAKLDSFDPQRDRLAVVWYRDHSAEEAAGEDGDEGWRIRRALQDLLESYRPNGPQLSVDRPDGAEVGRLTHVPSVAGYCLGAGRYVAELFLNGELVGSASADLDTVDLSVIRSRELGLMGCVPSTWERFGGTSQEWRPDTPARTFVLNEDGRAKFGTAIATFYAPSGMSEMHRQDYFLRRTIQLMFKKDQSSSQWSQDAEDSLIRGAVDLNDPDTDCNTDEALGGVVYRFLTDDLDKNVVRVVVVNGGQANQACPIIKSFTNYSSN